MPETIVDSQDEELGLEFDVLGIPATVYHEEVLAINFRANVIWYAEIIDYDLAFFLNSWQLPKLSQFDIDEVMSISFDPRRGVFGELEFDLSTLDIEVYSPVYIEEELTIDFALGYGYGVDFDLDIEFTIAPSYGNPREVEVDIGVDFYLTGFNPTCLSRCMSGMPTLTRIDSATVTFDDGSTTITLRAPNSANREEINTTRIYRTTANGDLIVFADADWPKTYRHTLEFSALSEEKANEFYDFLAGSVGLLVTYTDYDSQEWEGIIMTPDAEFFQTGKSDCSFGTSIQFEGQRT